MISKEEGSKGITIGWVHYPFPREWKKKGIRSVISKEGSKVKGGNNWMDEEPAGSDGSTLTFETP